MTFIALFYNCAGKMNPFKSEKSVKPPKGERKRGKRRPRKRENVDGRRFRRYEDDDPDFKCHVKKSNNPIPDNYVPQMGKHFDFSFRSIQQVEIVIIMVTMITLKRNHNFLVSMFSHTTDG